MIELACAAIVTTWLVLRTLRETTGARAAFLSRVLIVAAAAWIAEDSAIRLYGFYAYASSWHAFLDQVPLAIVCIWPVVVLSALDLARALAPKHIVLVAALVVLADASLIEPIATASSLWAWTEPGPFHVPLIGVLGWAFFGAGAAFALTRARALTALALAPLTAHALLLFTWWSALRWLPRGVDAWPFVVVAWALCVALSIAVVVRGVRVPRRDLLLRIPAASFFFVLLALHPNAELVAYALAFAPPYLVLTARAPR